MTADFPLTLVADFFQAFADRGRLTLHLDILAARNGHHAAEAAFKAAALALRQAIARRSGSHGCAEHQGDALRMNALVIDTGVGNLGNLVRAVERVGGRGRDQRRSGADRRRPPACCSPASAPSRPRREAVRGGVEAALREALARGAWLLGICVGFQILFDEGEEFGVTDGLGLLPGRVTRLPETVPVPHIGWNRLHGATAHPLLEGLAEPLRLLRPQLSPRRACRTTSVSPAARHGRAFPAVAGRGRVMGTQFHPERSGAAGLRLLSNFLKMSGDGAWS